jgi:hypothetical protein
MVYLYGRDEPEIKAWIDANQTAEGAAAYLEEHVHKVPDHAAYLEWLGEERMAALRRDREVG